MSSKQYITSDHSLVNIFYIKELKCSKFHQYSTFRADFTYTLGISQSQSISHLIISLWNSTTVFWLVLLFCNLQFCSSEQLHPLFSQFCGPLLSFSLSLWSSGVLESPLKSLITARRVLNLSIRVFWALWSLTSEPWGPLRELRECTAVRPRSFSEECRGMVMLPSSPGCSMSLMTSHK